MDLTNLIKVLGSPSAYPFATDQIEVHQTHISVVFLAGPFAYKIKKPVNLNFLDFSTLDKRKFYCAEEVRLNRRLAPEVYLGVVPITAGPDGLEVEGRGEVVEWAVKMQRLPAAATLEKRLQRGEVGEDMVVALAQKVAAFHARAADGEHIAAFGRFEVVAGNARENFTQALPLIDTTVSQAVFTRLRNTMEELLPRLQPLIEARAARGVPRDTHGDLHLDHVYLFPDRPKPHDLLIIDCIEFNERFRYGDPVADMAFLVMDLGYHGRPDLADAFTEAYFQAAGDGEGRALLPMYTAYRAMVRAKVEGFELTEKEVPEAERRAALTRARAHWLLALGEVAEPRDKPCLLLIGGLPGTGKSTLARALAEQAGFALIRSDLVRKELAGLPSMAAVPPQLRDLIYGPVWTERTYAECCHWAEQKLFEGQRVLVDANFRRADQRQPFLTLARQLGVPLLFLHCHADEKLVRQRLAQRQADASDADWRVYQQLANQWEAGTSSVPRHDWPIDTSGTTQQSLKRALGVLKEQRIF